MPEISRFHFRGLLIEISSEFVCPRTVKKHSTNNKGKKREFLPFTIGFWVQLRPLTASTRERKLHVVFWLSSRSGRWALISTLCMRSKISSVYLSPVSTCIQVRWRHLIPLIKQDISDKILAHCGPFYVLLCVFTWLHGGHICVPKQWKGGHVCVPNQSWGSWTLFLCKRFLLFQ